MYAIKLRYGFDVNQDIYKAFDLFKMSGNKGYKKSNDNIYMKCCMIVRYLEICFMQEKNYGIYACYEQTCEIVKRMSISEDFNKTLDFFGKGIYLTDSDYEFNSNTLNILSDLKFAAKDGDVDALCRYGEIILDINKSSFESKENAIKYIKEAAYKGHAEANLRYGQMLYNRNGVEINKKEAADFFSSCC